MHCVVAIEKKNSDCAGSATLCATASLGAHSDRAHAGSGTCDCPLRLRDCAISCSWKGSRMMYVACLYCPDGVGLPEPSVSWSTSL